MLAVHIDRGTILIGHEPDREGVRTPPALATLRVTSSSGRSVSGTFDEIEQAWLAGGDNALLGRGPRGYLQMRSSGGMVEAAVVSESTGSAPAAPLRVGGTIRVPTRTQYAEPIYPPTARDARIQGVVILELTIGEDGAVSNARVLRSIPLLDEAALAAVRQWRYEPTLLNGVPRPVIMTVTVNFALPSP